MCLSTHAHKQTHRLNRHVDLHAHMCAHTCAHTQTHTHTHQNLEYIPQSPLPLPPPYPQNTCQLTHRLTHTHPHSHSPSHAAHCQQLFVTVSSPEVYGQSLVRSPQQVTHREGCAPQEHALQGHRQPHGQNTQMATAHETEQMDGVQDTFIRHIKDATG